MQKPSFSVPLFSHFRGAVVVTAVAVVVEVVVVVVGVVVVVVVVMVAVLVVVVGLLVMVVVVGVVKVVIVLGEGMFTVVLGSVNGVRVEVVAAVKLVMRGADVIVVFKMSAMGKEAVASSVALLVF